MNGRSNGRWALESRKDLGRRYRRRGARTHRRNRSPGETGWFHAIQHTPHTIYFPMEHTDTTAVHTHTHTHGERPHSGFSHRAAHTRLEVVLSRTPAFPLYRTPTSFGDDEWKELVHSPDYFFFTLLLNHHAPCEKTEEKEQEEEEEKRNDCYNIVRG